jgi:hypothetical protein
MATRKLKQIDLGDEFGPAVIRVGKTRIIVGENQKLIVTTGDDIEVHSSATLYAYGNDLRVQPPSAAVEQTNARGNDGRVATATPTIQSFSPDNAIIRGGLVQLNKISQYLTDLPDSATAELLIAPQDLAKIDGGGLGTWINSVKRISYIRNYHGLDGMRINSIERIRQIESCHSLDGMKISDRPKTAPDVTYEKDWAGQVRAAFNQARATGKAVTTGLFMPTKELLHGRKIGAGPKEATLDNNLYSLRDKVTREGDTFAKRGSGSARWQWSSTENPDHPSHVYAVVFTCGSSDWDSKNGRRLSSRPVGLAIQP